MKYTEAISFLYDQLPMFQKKGPIALKKDLRNIKRLCSWLGNPHQNLKFIHVAGTNGKGSVSHYLASFLSLSGLKVGLYTSPHYKDFRERIKIHKCMISKKSVVAFVKKYIAFSKHNKDFQPSFFEITVAMSFWEFERQKVDMVILETGLGGRLDSTNIVLPLISVITNISFDHQWTLGNTLKKIAREKAGIIKKETPVLIGEYQAEVAEVFKNKAIAKNSKLIWTKNEIQVQDKESTLFIDKEKQSIKLDFPVAYQRKNFRTSLAVFNLLQKLRKEKLCTPRKIERDFQKELKSWKYYGRMNWLSKSPQVLIDSAHNEAGLTEFFKYIKQLEYSDLHIITGFVKDKDLNSVLPLFPSLAKYYFVAAKIPRAMNTTHLKDQCEKYDLIGKSYKSTRRALAAARRSAKTKDLICVIGSIFVVSEVI